MELINIRDDDRMSEFYRVAWLGDEQTLVKLLQRDATILANIPDGRQTPLHISALLGHVPFTVVLLDRHRELDIREDSSRRTALHLASAEGHIDIVKELLQVNNKPCLNRDVEGRIPLHYAAMRGRTEIVQELIMARPDSLSLGDGEESSVFHLCVTHNHLNTLKTLVKLDYATANITAGQPRPSNFKHPDRVGNTILHLAIMLKRVEVVSYLMSISEIRETENFKNKKGFTANDIFEQSPKDFKICEIQHMLSKAEHEGFKTDVVPHQDDDSFIKMFKCVGNYFMKILRWIGDWLEHDDEWLKEMRENLSLVSTVIATITFQALINPPGGFIQQGLSSSSTSSSSSKGNTTPSSNNPLNCITLDDNHERCPGQAMASSSVDLLPLYKEHLVFVTISFFSSLSVALLIVSGIFPMKNKAVIWLASIGMCITLTSLAAAYISAIEIITPSYLWDEGLIWKMEKVAFLKVWASLLELIGVLITLRFFIWAVKKCDMIFKKSRSWVGRENGRRRRFLYVLFRVIVIFVMLVVFSIQSFVVYLAFLLLVRLYNLV